MVDNVSFEAAGPPGWRVEIGDDIGLHLGDAFYGGGMVYTEELFPLTGVRDSKGVRRWSASNGVSRILIIASPGPCTSAGGSIYSHAVRLILSWGGPRFGNLRGCGGRLISEPDPE